jgi:hypothetical protein
MIPAHKLPVEKVKDFFFAGNATVTLKNTKTGNRFTYKISTPKKQKDERNPVYFVNVMTGSDNVGDFDFVGTIFGKNSYVHSAKSPIKEDAVSMVVIKAFINFLINDKVPNGVEVWHEGLCGKCGQKLTVPESIYTGLGPVCVKNLLKAKAKLEMTELANDKGLTHNVIQAFKSQYSSKKTEHATV